MVVLTILYCSGRTGDAYVQQSLIPRRWMERKSKEDKRMAAKNENSKKGGKENIDFKNTLRIEGLGGSTVVCVGEHLSS